MARNGRLAGLLQIVSGPERDELGVANARGEESAVRGRDGRVVIAADHEGGCADAAEHGDAGPGRDGRELPDQSKPNGSGLGHRVPRLGVRYHLALAGRDDALFSDDAVRLIHQTSRGYPRAVNNLALQALVAAFAADKAIVDESTTRTAIAEVTAD